MAAGLGAVLLVGWMGRSARGPHGGEAPSGPAQPVDQLLALGDLYTARGSSAALLDRAITTFREAAELRPEDGATHAGVARAAATVAGTWPWRTEHLDTARSALRRAAIVAPEAPSTLLARAIVSFHDRRDLDQARRDLEKVLEDRPDDPEALLYMGRTLTAMGSLDRALPSLERGRRLAPSDPRVHVALGRALRIAGRLDEALHTLDEAWALAPDDLWAYLSLFWALVAAGDYEGAEELVAARPAGLDHRFVAPGLGHVAFHRGDLVSAMELLAAESHPDAQTLAQAAHLLGDTTAQRRWARIALERAENALARVHEAAPEERSTVLLAHTFGRLGLAHALLGHEAAARDHAQRARATHPAERDLEMGFPPVMLRARTLAVLGDVAGARAELAPWLERPSLLYRAPGALGPLLGPVVDAGPRSPAARRPVGLGTPLRVSSDQPG